MDPCSITFQTTINIEGIDTEVEIVAEGEVGIVSSRDADGRLADQYIDADVLYLTINDLKGNKLFDAVDAPDPIYDLASGLAWEKMKEEYTHEQPS
jgi:hypothetical protein